MCELCAVGLPLFCQSVLIVFHPIFVVCGSGAFFVVDGRPSVSE